MSGNDELRSAVRQWVARAEEDFLAASDLLQAAGRRPVHAACFHLQQCIEKYLKAILASHQIPFPRTHDISELLFLLPESPAFVPSVEQERRLTSYATVTRYPGDWEPISMEEAQATCEVAASLRKALRLLLPPDALECEG